MSSWNFMDHASRDTLLEVMNRAADEFTALVSDPDTWHDPTASGHWQVRDLAGHLVDTIEGYFPGFDAARGRGSAPEPLGLRVMDTHVDKGAQRFRDTPQAEVLERLKADRAKINEIFENLTADEWSSLLVTHPYMGPLPAGFYPAFQLVDWAIHSWDIRQATGRNHVLAADVADLLAPGGVRALAVHRGRAARHQADVDRGPALGPQRRHDPHRRAARRRDRGTRRRRRPGLRDRVRPRVLRAHRVRPDQRGQRARRRRTCRPLPQRHLPRLTDS